MPTRSEQIEQGIRTAIEQRRPLALEYRWPGQGVRTVHPHVLYRTETGALRVDTYQLDGYTASGKELPGWRAFDLRQVVRADLLDGEFAVAPDFNPAARKYRGGIVASV